MDIRNIAIIAHVDHGKTTLVDEMLKQTHTFRNNQAEMTQTTILDSNDLEREKGITILAKNTAVTYTPLDSKEEQVKINIIDTPGHADFGGEVERVLNMADGAILLVDAAEGPLPQTTFVLKKAIQNKLKVIVVVNKIDKPYADPQGTLAKIEDVFLQVAHDESHLQFVTMYAIGRDGKAWDHLPTEQEREEPSDLRPLFTTIINEIPSARADDDQPLAVLISTLEADQHLGTLCIGRVSQGTIRRGSEVAVVGSEGQIGKFRIEKLFVNQGLDRVPVEFANSGEIVSIAGLKVLRIGLTVTDPANPITLPNIEVSEPTLKITIGPNTSPMAGRSGQFVTSRQIQERLLKEVETNLGLRVSERADGLGFVVAGRGELHLAVLIETMRREGYELEVSRPQVIFKEVDGVKMEPFDEVIIEVPDEFAGAVSSEFGKRKAVLQKMDQNGRGETRLVFEISEQNLLGARNALLTDTRGTLQMNAMFIEYRPIGSVFSRQRNGVLVASEAGTSASQGLENAQERGSLFIGAGEQVYAGMIVGLNAREQDMRVNVCKIKASSNVRSANKDMMVKLTPPVRYSLEQSLDFLADDELLEITPDALRLRKMWLTQEQEARARKGLSN